MITRNDMKQKYASEFDRQANYRQIVQKIHKKQPPYPLIVAMASVLFVFCTLPLFQQKSADNAVLCDQAAQELGPEIVLNVNEIQDPAAGAMRADMKVSIQDTEVPEYLLDLCPEGFTHSQMKQFSFSYSVAEEEKASHTSISFENEDQSIRLSVAEDTWPYRCALLENSSISKIDGVEIKIGYDITNEMYLCLFELRDKYYDIETMGLNKNELIEFLLNLIKKVRSTE